MTIYWKAVDQYFAVLAVCFPVCNLEYLINFGLGSIRNDIRIPNVNINMKMIICISNDGFLFCWVLFKYFREKLFLEYRQRYALIMKD